MHVRGTAYLQSQNLLTFGTLDGFYLKDAIRQSRYDMG
jgi:hypothetical protein